ncbi:hypothetical protein PGT21_018678 [Puccinia graminis f. sp. tritici]|uniref:Uncharacterized protein n=1 Tax=Puccinia graminis f. sp. tritici TaxID=56615 RepID=A0A5B0NUR4_PUCGR|nr:hypothetical protein PGT21_018678 [Puccinia graminis f. sp. tritici]
MATPKTAKTLTAKTLTAPKPIESLTTPKPAESSNINNNSTPKSPESAPKKGFPGRIPSWLTVQPRRPRRKSSWSARLYSLAEQEDSLLVGGTTSPAQEGILLVDGEDSLLVDEAVQPRRHRRDWSARLYNLVDQEYSLLVESAIRQWPDSLTPSPSDKTEIEGKRRHQRVGRAGAEAENSAIKFGDLFGPLLVLY